MALLLLCLVVFIGGLVLHFVGLGIERRANMRMMEMAHEARWAHRDD